MQYTSSQILFALGLTLFAGLSTGIGSLIGLYTKRANYSFLSVALGFSAGVMIFVSLVEIFQKANVSLSVQFGDKIGFLYTCLSFFGGILLIALIDQLVPKGDNPHEYDNLQSVNEQGSYATENRSLMRMGLLSAIAIGIHNFPEGVATFISALKDPGLGISIAVAIAIHNIPEGIAVSVPIYFSTGNKRKAFLYSFLSGLAEPVGALIGFLFFMRFFTDATFGIVFAMVSGIMVYISIDELLPTAEKYGRHHLTILGVILGMVVMAASLVLFK